MIDFLYHFIGFCGEHGSHPTLISGLLYFMAGFGLIALISKVKNILNLRRSLKLK
jgi:hypothetical protein